MGFIGNMIESRVADALQSALGLRITFEKLDVSLAGTIDARNVAIFANASAPDSMNDDASNGSTSAGGLPPLLTIERVKAQIAVTRALKGEIIVKSIVIARPMIDVVLGAEGNVPAKLLRSSGERGKNRDSASEAGDNRNVGKTAVDTDETKDEERKGWRVDIERVLLTDGRVRVRSGVGGGKNAYDFWAQSFFAEFGSSASTTEQDDVSAGNRPLTVILGKFTNAGAPLDLNEVRITGRFSNLTNLADFADAGVDADIDVGGLLRINASASSLAEQRFRISADGSVDVARLLVSIVGFVNRPTVLDRVEAAGRLDLSLRGEFSREAGMRIGELTFRAADVQARPRMASKR